MDDDEDDEDDEDYRPNRVKMPFYNDFWLFFKVYIKV